MVFLLHTAPNVFSFPVFTLSFCQQFMEELDHFEQSDIPKGRPNTMNNSGVSITCDLIFVTLYLSEDNLKCRRAQKSVCLFCTWSVSYTRMVYYLIASLI